MAAVAPARLGLLLDPERPLFVEGVQLGLDELAASGRLDRPVELVPVEVDGLPTGAAMAVEQGFETLAASGVLIVLGPGTTDNTIVVKELADRHRLPTINFSGTEEGRAEHLFQYQTGSHEEEPYLLARYMVAEGLTEVSMVHDRATIGSRYASFFDDAAARHGIAVVDRVALSPVATDARAQVARLSRRRPPVLVHFGLGLSAPALARALAASDWHPIVLANTGLGYAHYRPEWRAGYDGWTYVDHLSDTNPLLAELMAKVRDADRSPSILAIGYDLGRLAGEALALAPRFDRRSMLHGLERVKALPSATGRAGTTMGFGAWDRVALKGEFLVLRRWCDGRSVELPPLPATPRP